MASKWFSGYNGDLDTHNRAIALADWGDDGKAYTGVTGNYNIKTWELITSPGYASGIFTISGDDIKSFKVNQFPLYAVYTDSYNNFRNLSSLHTLNVNKLSANGPSGWGYKTTQVRLGVTYGAQQLNEVYGSLQSYYSPELSATSMGGHSVVDLEISIPTFTTSESSDNLIAVAYYIQDVLDAIEITEKSKSISCSFSISDETKLGDSTYKITSGSKTINCSVTSDYSWEGTLTVGSNTYNVSNYSTSVTVSLPASAWASTKNISLSVSNTYNTASASKTYHVGQAPGTYTYGQGSQYCGVNAASSKRWNSSISNYGTGLIVDNVNISDTSIVSSVDIVEITSEKIIYDINAPKGSNGECTIVVTYHDEYGNGQFTFPYKVRLVPSPMVTVPASIRVGDTVTLINSSVTTGVTETDVYKWEIMKPGSAIYEEIPGYVWVAKSKNLDYVFNSADTYKIKLTSSLDGLGGAGYYREYYITPYSPLPEPTFTITPETRYVAEDITLTCTNVSEEIDDYEWYVDGSVYARGQVANIQISTVGSHTIKLRLYADEIYRESSTTINVLTVAPALSFTYEPTQGITKGTIVTCTNTSTEVPGTNPTYSWTVNGTVYTSKNCSFVVGSGSTLSVTLRGSVGAYQSTPVTTSIPVETYVDPNTRFTIAVFNGDNFGVFTRNQTDCMFTGLHFEKRLNEVGSGSVKVMIPNDTTQYQEGALVQGSDIIILDDLTPVYYGIVTSVSTVNNIPFGREVTKTLIDVEFAEATRKLSTVQCTNNEIVPDATVDTICRKIIPAKNCGNFDTNANIKYTFSVSNSDVLSQLDSFNDQCSCKYICRPNIVFNKLSGEYNSINTIDVIGTTIPTNYPNTYVFASDGVHYMFGKVYGTSSNRVVVYNDNINNIPFGSEVKFTIFDGYVIDNKQSYYDQSVIPTDNNQLVVNKTCYDVDNIDNLNKNYGSVVCTSPQDSGLNVVCTIPLNSVVNPDGTMDNTAYISQSKDTSIYDTSVQGTSAQYNLYIYGNYEWAEVHELWYNYGSAGYQQLEPHSANTSIINGRYVTFAREAWVAYPPYGDVNYRDLVGDSLVHNIYKLSNSLTGTMTKIYIGGQVVEGTYNSATREFTVDMTKLPATPKNISHRNGSLVQSYTASANSPYSKYPDKILSVTLQRNMSYADVELIASTIARYGSNFTSTCNGTCNIKYWKNRLTSTLPLPGDHIKMKYNDTETMDYELVSYTVNCDTMSVDFNVGMQPLNVGDVIYRLNQNMTTNITTQ